MQRAIFLAAVVLVLGGIGLFLLLRPPTDAADDIDAPPGDERTALADGRDAPPPPGPSAAAAGGAARSGAATPNRSTAPAPAPVDAEPPAADDRVTLHVDSDVPGAQVFVDRRFVGETPLTTTDVTPGRHQINVAASGYDSYAQALDLAPGRRDVVVRFKEVRLDARLPVVHKHGIGSCRGTLVATPRGLRYETGGDHAFTAPLTDLDTLAVDYLEKNLRIRTAGRDYNFTDPDGNADRLLVFQQAVAKARERLLAGDPPAAD